MSESMLGQLRHFMSKVRVGGGEVGCGDVDVRAAVRGTPTVSPGKASLTAYPARPDGRMRRYASKNLALRRVWPTHPPHGRSPQVRKWAGLITQFGVRRVSESRGGLRH